MTTIHRRRAATVILAITLTLTACSAAGTPKPSLSSLPEIPSDSPSESAQPTPDASPGDIPELTPPTFPQATTEQEAINQAREGVEAFNVATSYLFNARGKYADRIKDFADGSALAFLEKAIAAYAAQTKTVEGSPQIKNIIYATATKNRKYGEPIEFGYVDMMVCGDISEYRVFDAEGKEIEIAPVTQARVNYAASFQPDTGKWIVEVADVQRQNPKC